MENVTSFFAISLIFSSGFRMIFLPCFSFISRGLVENRLGQMGTRVPITRVIRFDTHYPSPVYFSTRVIAQV